MPLGFFFSAFCQCQCIRDWWVVLIRSPSLAVICCLSLNNQKCLMFNYRMHIKYTESNKVKTCDFISEIFWLFVCVHRAVF